MIEKKDTNNNCFFTNIEFNFVKSLLELRVLYNNTLFLSSKAEKLISNSQDFNLLNEKYSKILFLVVEYIYSSKNYNNKIEANFNNIKELLYEIGIESTNILIKNSLNYIQENTTNKYSIEAIQSGIPDYYDKIALPLKEYKNEYNECCKNTDTICKKDEFDNFISILEKVGNLVSLVEKKQKVWELAKKDSRRKLIKKISIALLLGTITSGVVSFIYDFKNNAKTEQKTEQRIEAAITKSVILNKPYFIQIDSSIYSFNSSELKTYSSSKVYQYLIEKLSAEPIILHKQFKGKVYSCIGFYVDEEIGNEVRTYLKEKFNKYTVLDTSDKYY